MQHHLFQYFANDIHCSFLEDLIIIFVDKNGPKDPNLKISIQNHQIISAIF